MVASLSVSCQIIDLKISATLQLMHVDNPWCKLWFDDLPAVSVVSPSRSTDRTGYPLSQAGQINQTNTSGGIMYRVVSYWRGIAEKAAIGTTIALSLLAS